MADIPRREFLTIAPAAAGGLALATRHRRAETPQSPATVRISAASYGAALDYPILPKRHSEVTLTDHFWRPKVALNSEVTIPSQVRNLTERGRALGGNVLEAAILSLETHPDPQLQAQVDARVHALARTPAGGNNTFEVATAHYAATGKRDLL
ncbi:MAG TPA: hypothetical protein VLD67_07140, partial [Vicinamibacterales bacterium]|nr:hypothetical protein [Vicinamibacterales bacterium]